MPLPTNLDIPTFLYLNPELVAYHDVRSVEQVIAGFDSFPPGLVQMPPALPPGFDSRVYLASQEDVSGLNATIAAAMKQEGLDDAAVRRRGIFVGTIMQPVELLTPNSFRITPNTSNPFQLSDSNLRAGDEVKLLRHHGDAMYGVVTSVSPTSFSLSNTTHAASVGGSYTLFGIRIADPERQARVAYSRRGMQDADDAVPRHEFDHRMYQIIYPDTRGYSTPDTYIDYRTRWKRNDDYRVIVGRDIFNLSAPYSSNLLSAAATAGGNFDVAGSFSAASNSVLVTPSNAVVRSNLIVGDGFLTASPSVVSVAGGNLYVWADGLASCSNLIVEHSNARLDSGITLAHSNVVVTSATFTVSQSNLTVDCDGVELAGENLVARWGHVKLGAGNLVISNSNAELLGDMTFVNGGVGIGMPPGELTAADARLCVSGDIFATGTLVTQSDRRAKSELRTIDGPLDKVARLRGYTFDMATQDTNSDTDRESSKRRHMRRHTGLIAQDVHEVLPEAVYPGANGMMSIAYGNLAGLLVEAINALSARIDRIETALAHPVNAVDDDSNGVP